jgi:hypothetical protein
MPIYNVFPRMSINKVYFGNAPLLVWSREAQIPSSIQINSSVFSSSHLSLIICFGKNVSLTHIFFVGATPPSGYCYKLEVRRPAGQKALKFFCFVSDAIIEWLRAWKTKSMYRENKRGTFACSFIAMTMPRDSEKHTHYRCRELFAPPLCLHS